MTPGTRSIEEIRSALAKIDGYDEYHRPVLEAAIDELAVLREQVAKQEAALRPFAAIWEFCMANSSEGWVGHYKEMADEGRSWVDKLTWADLRNASRALSPAETQEEAKP